MPKKRTVSASKTADKFATLALKHLSQYSEEEQEERISWAEKTEWLSSPALVLPAKLRIKWILLAADELCLMSGVVI